MRTGYDFVLSVNLCVRVRDWGNLIPMKSENRYILNWSAPLVATTTSNQPKWYHHVQHLHHDTRRTRWTFFLFRCIWKCIQSNFRLHGGRYTMIQGSQLKGRIAFTHCMHTKKMMYTLHWMRAKVNHSNWSIQIKCNRCVKPKNITQKCKFEHMIHTLALAVVLALVFTLTLTLSRYFSLFQVR